MKGELTYGTDVKGHSHYAQIRAYPRRSVPHCVWTDPYGYTTVPKTIYIAVAFNQSINQSINWFIWFRDKYNCPRWDSKNGSHLPRMRNEDFTYRETVDLLHVQSLLWISFLKLGTRHPRWRPVIMVRKRDGPVSRVEWIGAREHGPKTRPENISVYRA